MGRKWGVESPPEEAYSRVTNPERFRPLHGSAERLLGRLEATFDVEREEGYELDDEFDRHTARPTVRLAPRSTEGWLAHHRLHVVPGAARPVGPLGR
jgi:hypothetical protein